MNEETRPGTALPSPARPSRFCPYCLPALVWDQGRIELAHDADAEHPGGGDHPLALTGGTPWEVASRG